MTPGAPVTVSVVILTHNRPDMLAKCLDSLPVTAPGLEILVVDNSTDDQTATLVRQSYPTVNYQTIAPTPHILSLGRNLGAAHTTGEFVAFLDDDVTVDPGWLPACRAAITTPEVGAVGGRILDPEVEHRDFHRGAPICRILPDGRRTDNQECDPGQTIEVDHLRGCNWAVRRAAFEAAGRFDETWDTYAYEEFDLALRIRKAGYKLLFTPTMSVYHHLVPRQGDIRYKKTFRRRFQQVRMLTYSYAKSRHAVLWRYVFCGDSGLRALLRHPSPQNWAYVCSGYCGKLVGLWRCLRHRIPVG